ncbi:hypothetical protein PGTUg99_031995 [Puccinia graminis f. sp. tritici]|uniref:Cytochrome b561 domain-containing protein n=1 Tax=Puccinia graminis f. sp. tritici TaxID=56615 RepID=A0A5B0QS40_PUCGR|nr:hypothetical protein PGTUg99_031995 [Puccinia graminis f. sp. tritici]
MTSRWIRFKNLLFVGLAFRFLIANSKVSVVVVGHGGDHSSRPPPSPDSLPISPPKLVIVHIVLQLLTWGILLPMGVMLGLGRSRLHGPVQAVAGLLLSLPATSLPHLSARHPYPATLHAALGAPLFGLLLLQICLGFFLKSHWLQTSRFRSLIQLGHSIIGKSFIPLAWLQILLGAVASLSFCYGDHLGQCLAHMIMGSAFVGYGVVMLSLMEFGKPWLKAHQLSPEYLDCCVITVWGVVNTFTYVRSH